jgi:hypothetical protein
MAGLVTDANRLTYRENVKLAVQERVGVFDNAFMFDANLKGEQAQIVDIIGTIEARRNAAEGGDTPNQKPTHEPVWCVPTRLDAGSLIEKGDVVRTLTDLKSAYVQSQANAMVRGRNAVLAEAVFANRRIGRQGETSSAWAGQTVAIDVDQPGTAHGMTVSKIMRAYRYWEEAEINLDEEEIFIGLNAEENEQLYNDIMFVSTEFRSKAVIEEKRVRQILEAKIIPTQRFSIYNPSAEISCAAMWLKSGMYWGEFSALDVRSAPNPNKQFREQTYVEQYVGATRGEDIRTIKVLNKKAA